MAFTRPKAAQIDFDATNISDSLIRINSSETGANANDIGIVFERGSHTNAALIFDESTDAFRFISTTHSGAGSTSDINISAHHNLHVGTLVYGSLNDGTTTLTSTVAELNHLDGVTGIALGNANELVIVDSDGTGFASSSTLSIDDGNNYIGINQTSPEVTLHMTGDGAQTAQIRMEQHNDTADAPDVRTRRSRGTAASPSNLSAGDYLFRINAEAYESGTYNTKGSIQLDTSSSDVGKGVMQFQTHDGSSLATRLQILDSGAIRFNSAYTFPTSDGSANQILTTNGSGVLSFASPASSSFTLAADSGTSDSFSTGGTLTFEGGTGVDTTVSNDQISIAIDSTVTTLSGTQTLTNKTLTSPTINDPTFGGVLALTSTSTTVSPLTLTANSLQDNVGSLRINSSEPDIFLNQAASGFTTVTFARTISSVVQPMVGFGKNSSDNLYMFRETAQDAANSTVYDNTSFVLNRSTGNISMAHDLAVTGEVSYGTLNDGTTTLTSTIAELNYVDGVTSAIQTQIDNISSSFTLAADSGSNDTFTTGQTLTIAGGTGIDTTVSDNNISIAIDSTVATLTGSQTLTNKTLTSPTINAFSGTGNGSITGTLSIVTTTTDDSLLITTTEDSSSAAPVFTLKRNSSSVADGDYLGQIKFKGENDADQEVIYAKITGKILDASDGTEDGIIEIAHKKAGSNNISARFRSDSLQLINGTQLTVDGTATFNGITVNSSQTINMGSNRITTVADPTSAQDAATKAYVDSEIAGSSGDSVFSSDADFDAVTATATVTEDLAAVTDSVATSLDLGTISVQGIVTSTAIVDANVTSAKIASSAVTTAKIADDAVTTAKIPDDAITSVKLSGLTNSSSGVVSADGDGTFSVSAGGSGLSNVVEDTTPQLGGDLASNGNNIAMADNDEIRVGSGNDIVIKWDATDGHITALGTLNIDGADGHVMAKFVDGGAATLYHNNTARLATTSVGISADQVFGISDTDTGIALGANGADIMQFYAGNNERVRVTTTGMQVTGNILPEANGTRDLGSASLRWQNIYTSDLNLNNGVGNYTVVEGEEDLFLYNNKSGKVFKFALIEVDPSEATPKIEDL